MRKALIFLFAFAISVAGYSQTSETYIKDANGNLVGTVSSYTNYVGATETTLYDQNGQKVGSIEGNNVTPLLGTYYTGQYTIVSGSDVSTVVLGSGTQALDYYLSISNNNSGGRYRVNNASKDCKHYNPRSMYQKSPEYDNLNMEQISRMIKYAKYIDSRMYSKSYEIKQKSEMLEELMKMNSCSQVLIDYRITLMEEKALN